MLTKISQPYCHFSVEQLMLYTMMRSITTVVSDMNRLLIFYFGSWWHEERDTILTMQIPSQCVTHLVMFKISVGRNLKNPTTSFNGQNPTFASMVWSQLTLFPNPQIPQDHLFRAWRHPHSCPIYCLGFIMTMVIVISFNTSINCTNWQCTWALISNNSKPKQTEW